MRALERRGRDWLPRGNDEGDENRQRCDDRSDHHGAVKSLRRGGSRVAARLDELLRMHAHYGDVEAGAHRPSDLLDRAENGAAMRVELRTEACQRGREDRGEDEG